MPTIGATDHERNHQCKSEERADGFLHVRTSLFIYVPILEMQREGEASSFFRGAVNPGRLRVARRPGRFAAPDPQRRRTGGPRSWIKSRLKSGVVTRREPKLLLLKP